MIDAFFAYPFLRHAFYAALLSSLVCGIFGPIIVTRRQVMLTGGIAHGAFGGVGLARWAGISPRLGAWGFTILLASIASPLSWRRQDRVDTLMGILWSAGMAIGLIFNDLTPGYGADLMSYLFGSILTVSETDLWFMAGLAISSLIPLTLRYHQVEAFLFDEDFAHSRGVPVQWYHFISVFLASIAVISIIRVVGLILVIALFTIPPFIAERHARSLRGIMLLSVLLSVVFCMAGLSISYYYDLTAGAAIIAIGCSVQLCDLLLFRRR